MLSARGRYALRVMAGLAEQDFDGFVLLNEIAQRQEMSIKHLELILRTLAQNRLLKGHLGEGGG